MKLKDAPDDELVRRLRAGEEKAMEVLYDRYAGLVYSVALKILQNSSDAEELTQDIFIRLWQKENYQSQRGSLKSFLGLLTRHRAIDRLRKRNTTRNFLNRWEKYLGKSSYRDFPFETLQGQERQERIQKALSFLPDKEREILMMNFFEGVSQAQIARKLNLPVGTVKSRVRAGFVKLKKLLLEDST